MKPSLLTPDAPLFHAGYVRVMLGVLQSRGLPVQRLLAGAGLGEAAALARREQPFSLREVDALVMAARATGASLALGLEVGQALSLSTHGPLGYAVACSPDLRHALQAVQRYGALRNASLGYRIEASRRGAALVLDERLDLGPARDFYRSVMVMVLLQMVQAVVGDAVGEARLEVPLPEREWRAPIERHFAGAVRYHSARLALHLDADLLNRPGITADARGHVQALEACERQAADDARSVEEGCSGRVRALLRTVAARAQAYPTLEAAAAALNVSTRTLIRHLAREGTRYQALLDESRKQRAWWYLQHTALPVAEIALQLGYADTRNFSRTFRRWHGLTPSAVRRHAGQPGASPAP